MGIGHQRRDTRIDRAYGIIRNGSDSFESLRQIETAIGFQKRTTIGGILGVFILAETYVRAPVGTLVRAI